VGVVTASWGIDNRVKFTNGTATVSVEVLHKAKAGHWNFSEKAMQN